MQIHFCWQDPMPASTYPFYALQSISFPRVGRCCVQGQKGQARLDVRVACSQDLRIHICHPQDTSWIPCTSSCIPGSDTGSSVAMNTLCSRDSSVSEGVPLP